MLKVPTPSLIPLSTWRVVSVLCPWCPTHTSLSLSLSCVCVHSRCFLSLSLLPLLVLGFLPRLAEFACLRWLNSHAASLSLFFSFSFSHPEKCPVPYALPSDARIAHTLHTTSMHTQITLRLLPSVHYTNPPSVALPCLLRSWLSLACLGLRKVLLHERLGERPAEHAVVAAGVPGDGGVVVAQQAPQHRGLQAGLGRWSRWVGGWKKAWRRQHRVGAWVGRRKKA